MIFYLAICTECTPILPQPFDSMAARDAWTLMHKNGTGHRVSYAEETR